MNINAYLEQLRSLNLRIRHQLDLAEMKVPVANDLIAQLAAVKLLHESVFLGPPILCRAYGAQEDLDESGQVILAALLVPGGIGVVTFDTDQYASMQDIPHKTEQEAALHFLAFDNCSPAIRALLLPRIEPLLQELCQLLARSERASS